MNPDLPKMFRVRQHFEGRSESDPAARITRELERIKLQDRVGRGQSVAIAVGSRGIANLPAMIEAVVRHVQAVGGIPFIIPAMGSHGGGTADGQRGVLESLGITEETMRCPIRANMETRVVAHTQDGLPIHFDSEACGADHLILVNRIKPHTRFSGRFQSGLLKMLMIGLGKRNGAELYHRATHTIDFDRLITRVVPSIMKARPVTVGLAVIENSLDQTYSVQAVEPDQLLDVEPDLLEQARSLMPRLPFDRADLLIIDQIGKNISGTGMDTNIIGRKQSDKAAGDDEYPKLRHIFVRGLTAATHGNASGIGLAEFCRTRVVDQMDYESTRVNSITAGHVTAAAIPMYFETDRQVLEVASTQAGLASAAELRWMWIKDTLHLSEVLCSEAYYGDAIRREDLDIRDEPSPIQFDATDNLLEAFSPEGDPTSVNPSHRTDDDVAR
jgi:hypothetical protein